jgi:alpha-amylase
MSFKSNWGSTFESPYDAFINYMNILSDFLLRVEAEYPTSIENEELNELLKTINDQEKVIEKLEKEIKSLKKKKKEA